MADSVIPELRGRVMIVDDTPENLALLKGLLASAGHDVLALPTGIMALRAAARNPPDLILLDVTMPAMDGYEVCRRLKDDSKLRDIPVIFLSALNAIEEKVQAFRVGGADYIAKPFLFEELQVKVRTQLTLRHLQLQQRGHAATAAVSPGAADSPGVELPGVLEGIDLAEGLQRVGGKRGLYRDLLMRFSAGRGETLRDIEAELACGNREKASRTAHSIVSVAGMLGAVDLCAAAAALEKAISAGDHDSELAAFARQFSRVYGSVNQWCRRTAAPMAGGAPRLNRNDLAALIADMARLLETDILSAWDLRDRLVKQLAGSDLSGEIARLDTQLQVFDIDGAQESLRHLAQAVEAWGGDDG